MFSFIFILSIIASVVFLNIHIEKIVTEKSNALILIDNLNAEYLFYDDIPDKSDYTFNCTSKREFDTSDIDSYLLSVIRRELDEYRLLETRIINNIKLIEDYNDTFDFILNENIGLIVFRSHLIKKMADRQEYRLCYGKKKNPPISSTVNITICYTSPAGRNSYTKNKKYNINEVGEFIRKAERKIDDETCIKEQISEILKIAQKNCDVCGLLIKRKCYQWNIDNNIQYLCPRCNNKFEKEQSDKAYTIYLEGDSSCDECTPPVLQPAGQAVTSFVKRFSQPRGGFINYKMMDEIIINDDDILTDKENIHGSYVGLVVDYLTRYEMDEKKDKEDVFRVSLMGAHNVSEFEYAADLLSKIDGVNAHSISAACQLVGYDKAYRGNIVFYKGVDKIIPDESSISNILIMIRRSVRFFSDYGPLISSGMIFKGGYTSVITSGDADYLTEDTLWDMKVSVSLPTKNNTLQLIIYYLLLKRTPQYRHNDIRYIGIFNPRKNIAYRYDMTIMDSGDLALIRTAINA